MPVLWTAINKFFRKEEITNDKIFTQPFYDSIYYLVFIESLF